MVEVDRPGDQLVSVLHAPRDVREERRPVPRPAAGEVLVRVSAVGVCASDVHYYEHGRIGDFVVDAPLVLGHEVSGVVVDVGPRVDSRRIGALVSIEPQVTDHWSEESRLGRYNLDPAVRFFATPPYDGAFCEYVAVPSELAFDVPPGLGAEEAALIEPLAVAVAAVRHGRVALGERVAVAGAGPIGLLIARVAVLAGATEVVVSDPLPEARERALSFGATRVLDPRSAEEALPGSGFHVFFDASGAPSAIEAGVRALRPAGRALLVGMGAESISLPLAVLQTREIEVRGVFRYANAWPAALALATSGSVGLADLITARFRLDRVEDALVAAGRRDQVKVIVVAGSEPGGGAERNGETN